MRHFCIKPGCKAEISRAGLVEGAGDYAADGGTLCVAWVGGLPRIDAWCDAHYLSPEARFQAREAYERAEYRKEQAARAAQRSDFEK
jgi:hypothetical protein